jgi:malonyl-CoA/methylmalonyl-CoA synthetase
MTETRTESGLAGDDQRGLRRACVDLPSSSDPIAWLDRAVRLQPERTFIETVQGRRLTYKGLADLSARLVEAIVRHDVKAGDRVVVRVDKSVEAISLYIACLRMGAVFVPLNTAYTAHEFGYFLGDAEPKLIVVRPEDFSATVALVPDGGRDRIETLGQVADGTLLSHANVAADAGRLEGKFEPNLLAALLYTSGTTGKPKAAMLTRGNLASNASSLVVCWRFTESDVLLHALPIFHAHGLFVATNTVLASAASMLFMSKFDADEVLRLLPRASVMMGVPTYFTRLLSHSRLSRVTTQHVRLFISGSAPLSAEHHREFEKRTGHAILERYGMTETLMNTSNPYIGERVPGSVGTPLPGVEVRITEPESGLVLTGREAVGMIEVRGPNVFQGYWRNPGKTAAEFRADGFFITGDIGRIDADGYVYVVGRAKDLIISGGYNVYPAEVEHEINALPGVLDSAVFGVPHPDFGEGVTAMVVPASGVKSLDERAVLRALKDRLAAYKLPKRVLFTTELPQNALGKVQKKVLRDAHSHLYQTS